MINNVYSGLSGHERASGLAIGIFGGLSFKLGLMLGKKERKKERKKKGIILGE